MDKFYVCNSAGNIYYIKSNYSEKEQKQSYSIVSMNTSGEELSNTDITQDIENDEEYYTGTMKMDAEDNLYVSSGDKKILTYDKEGKKTGEIKADAHLIGLAKTKDGSMVAGIKDDESGSLQICEIDTKSNKLANSKQIDDVGNFSNSCLINGSQYDLYIQGSDGIYGVDLADEQSIKVMDYVASNIEVKGLNKVLVLGEDKFLVTGYGTESSYVSVYSKEGSKEVSKEDSEDPAEETTEYVGEKIDITYAGTYVMEEVKSAAVAFNKANDKYRVIIKDYSSGEDPQAELVTDLLSGDVPDVLDVSSGGIERYISKGLLEDLYPMLEADKDISKEDLLEAPLKALETDGKLYSIASAFSLNAIIGAKEDFKSKQSWTIQDLIEYDKSKGDSAVAFGQYSRSEAIHTLVTGNINKYINWSTGECSFDSDEFIGVLDYAATYPAEMNYSEDDETYPSQVKSGKILLIPGFVGIDQIQLYKEMYGKDITGIGYPTQDATGITASYLYQMGITTQSKNKEGAWEFIKWFLTEDFAYTNMINGMGGLPIRKDSFEELIKVHSATESYTDSHGNEVEAYQSSWEWDDLEVAIKPSSKEDIQLFKSLVDNVSGIYSYDNKIMDIINEEAEEFFEGKNDAKTAAKNINNRVSTYVNENR